MTHEDGNGQSATPGVGNGADFGQRAVDLLFASMPLLEDAITHRREHVGEDDFSPEDVTAARDTLKNARDLFREMSIARRHERQQAPVLSAPSVVNPASGGGA